jgi:hypothetical protein
MGYQYPRRSDEISPGSQLCIFFDDGGAGNHVAASLEKGIPAVSFDRCVQGFASISMV